MVHSLSNFQPCLDLIRLIVFTRCAQPFTQLNEAPSKAVPSACAWARRTSENYTRTVHEERPRGRPHPHVGATSEMDDGRRRTAQWLLRSSFRTVLHASDHRFGAGTASSDGILRHRGAYFVEVCRKSTHKCVGGTTISGRCVGGFGRERDGAGFWHHVVSASKTWPDKAFLQGANATLVGLRKDTTLIGWLHSKRRKYVDKFLRLSSDDEDHPDPLCDPWQCATPACRARTMGIQIAGIFLRVDTPVMDYTCPAWVVNATHGYTTRHLYPTRLRYRWNATPDNVFNRPVPIKCVGAWCTPAVSCARAASGEFNPWEQVGERINEPAFWKADPPMIEHGLMRYGFRTAIVFGAGHDRRLLAQCIRERTCENSPKVLVDYERHGISDESYLNGSHMIACPSMHNYHVAAWVQSEARYEMQPCQCTVNQPLLNCQQLTLQSGHTHARSAKA
jgi:hypothetical protein